MIPRPTPPTLAALAPLATITPLATTTPRAPNTRAPNTRAANTRAANTRAALTPLAALTTLTLALTAPAAAQTSCFAATDAIATERWTEATTILKTRLADPACAEHTTSLRYTLAYATEKRATTDPRAACEAVTLYDQIKTDDPQVTAAVAAGRARSHAACQSTTPPSPTKKPDRPPTAPIAATTATPPDQKTPAKTLPKTPAKTPTKTPPKTPADPSATTATTPSPTPTPTTQRPLPATTTPNSPPTATLPPDRTTALILTLSATLAAATGGTLLYLGVQADADRQAAETDMRAARDLPTRDAAQTRFEDAADTATTLGLTGWSALALAAGLGAAATWAWLDDGPELTMGVGHVGINVRF